MRIDRTLNSPDGMYRVEIVQRENQTFGFASWKWLDSERSWVPEGRYSECIVGTAEEAVVEARSRVAWLQRLNALMPGARVRISDKHHWAQGASGTVAEPPDYVRELTSDWVEYRRLSFSAQGPRVFYWVVFDEPHDDGSGDGPYSEAEIDADYLMQAADPASDV